MLLGVISSLNCICLHLFSPSIVCANTTALVGGLGQFALRINEKDNSKMCTDCTNMSLPLGVSFCFPNNTLEKTDREKTLHFNAFKEVEYNRLIIKGCVDDVHFGFDCHSLVNISSAWYKT